MESVLQDANGQPIRVFVVWEPVLITDWRAPGAAAVSRVPDPRAVQLWDPGHLLSAEIRKAAQSDESGVLGSRRLHGRIVWDFVGLYPAGVRWNESFPRAAFAGAPVVRVIEEFRSSLTRTLRSDGEPGRRGRVSPRTPPRMAAASRPAIGGSPPTPAGSREP